MKKYLCPVCGYDEMDAPPKDYHICSCCGTEFENDDFNYSHETLRSEWIGNGMKWFSGAKYKPENWNPIEQLKNVNANTETT